MLSRINDNKVMVKTEYGMSTRIPTIKPTIASEISCILTKHITTQQVKKSTTIILNRNEYQLANGDVLLTKTVLVKALKAKDIKAPDGTSLYSVNTHVVVKVKSAEQ